MVKVWAVLGNEFVKRCCSVSFTALDLNGNDVFLPPDFRVGNKKVSKSEICTMDKTTFSRVYNFAITTFSRVLLCGSNPSKVITPLSFQAH